MIYNSAVAWRALLDEAKNDALKIILQRLQGLAQHGDEIGITKISKP